MYFRTYSGLAQPALVAGDSVDPNDEWIGVRAKLAPACPPLRVPKDIISERIDVFAQRALLRMLKADAVAKADASDIVCAIKTGRLAGIGVLSGDAPLICRDRSAPSGDPPKCNDGKRPNDLCVRDYFQEPEHYILVFGYEKNRFVFWDTVPFVSTALLRYGDGFGLLFYDPQSNRLTTAQNDADMAVQPSGMHESKFQKRFQVLSIHPM